VVHSTLEAHWLGLRYHVDMGGERPVLLGGCDKFVAGVGILRMLGALIFETGPGRTAVVRREKIVVYRRLLGIGRSVGVGLLFRSR
jgi:hypothetical protein